MTIVGRLELDHPNLGTSGGQSLWDAINDIYIKLGDACNPRFYRVETLGDGASVDLDHNYQVAFDQIRYDLYDWNTGDGELTRIADTSGYTVEATPGNESTQIRVTNNTGGAVDIVVQLFNDPVDLGELENVDLQTTPPEDGQALVYDEPNTRWVAGASGDSSFKLQSISGETLTIKKGFIILGSAVEVYAPNDLSIDFSIAERQDNGTYTVFINLALLPDETEVNGRPVRIVTSDEIATTRTEKPYQLDLESQAPIGTVQRTLGVLENPETLATRRHTNDTATVSSLEYELPKQAIGAVGEAGNIRAGHELTSNSLPSGSAGSFYNLANNGNDNSGQTRNMTDNGTPVYGVTGIKGVGGAVDLNGTDAFLSSTDNYFNPGGSVFSCGGWYNQNTIQSNANLFSQWEFQDLDRSYSLRTIDGEIQLVASNDGTTVDTYITGQMIETGVWFHVAITYDGSDLIKVYYNGVLISTFDVGVLNQITNPSFQIGSTNSEGSALFPGRVDEFFFDQDHYPDDDINKIFAHQVDHFRNVETASQRWVANLRNGDHATTLYDFLIDTDLDRVRIDLFGQADDSDVTIKMYDDGPLGSTTAVRSMERRVTAAELDAQLPISHRLPIRPQAMELWVEVVDGSGDFEQVDTSAYLLANDNQIVSTGTTLASVLGSDTNVNLIASVGAQAVVGTTGTTGGDGDGGGEAGINYVQNTDAETDATTGTTQVDVTTTEETASPLIETQSFRVTSQGIADGYHGWVIDAIDNYFLDTTKLKFTGLVEIDAEGWAVDIWNLTDSMQVTGTESDLPIGKSTFSVGAVPETGKTYLPRLVSKTAANGSIALADRIFYGFTQTGAADLNGWKSYDNAVVTLEEGVGTISESSIDVTPYKDQINGKWYLKGIINIIFTTAQTSPQFRVNGIDIAPSATSGIGAEFYACSGSDGAVDESRAFITTNQNTSPNFFAGTGGSANPNWSWEFDIPLSGKPTWADYEPTGVALNNETLNANFFVQGSSDQTYSTVTNADTFVGFTGFIGRGDSYDSDTKEFVIPADGDYEVTYQADISSTAQLDPTHSASVQTNGGDAKLITSMYELDFIVTGSYGRGVINTEILSLKKDDRLRVNVRDNNPPTTSTWFFPAFSIKKLATFTSESTVVADLATKDTAGFVGSNERTELSGLMLKNLAFEGKSTPNMANGTWTDYTDGTLTLPEAGTYIIFFGGNLLGAMFSLPNDIQGAIRILKQDDTVIKQTNGIGLAVADAATHNSEATSIAIYTADNSANDLNIKLQAFILADGGSIANLNGLDGRIWAVRVGD